MKVSKNELRETIRYITSILNDRSDLNHDYAMKFIASDPATPSVVLKCMVSEIENPEVLERVAANPAATREILYILAKHENKEVRLAVANNQAASKLAVIPLTLDESPTVRFTLAENPYTDEKLLERLAADENPFVANRAEKTLVKLHSFKLRKI